MRVTWKWAMPVLAVATGLTLPVLLAVGTAGAAGSGASPRVGVRGPATAPEGGRF